MKKVGITGGIGSGKSLVCNILSTMGIPVFNADKETKQLYENNIEVKQSVMNLLGEQAYQGERLNRRYIAEIVFNSPALLTQLTQIVYPALHQYFDYWVNQQPQNTPYVIEEAAMLIESKTHLRMDVVVSVTASESTRITRVMQREQCSQQDVIQRISRQMNDEKRNLFANFVILNDGYQALLPQVIQLHEQLLKWQK